MKKSLQWSDFKPKVEHGREPARRLRRFHPPQKKLTVIRSPISFSKKVLDLFFCLWHKIKVNGGNAPGPKPARP